MRMTSLVFPALCVRGKKADRPTKILSRPKTTSARDPRKLRILGGRPQVMPWEGFLSLKGMEHLLIARMDQRARRTAASMMA